MFKFYNGEIKGIHFKFISKETMEVTREKLKTRFLDAKTIPGTRSYHHFVPLSSSCIGTKRASIDEQYASKFDFAMEVGQLQISPSLNSFTICLYDGEYWIGLIEEIDSAQKDIKIKFMHPKCPARIFVARQG